MTSSVLVQSVNDAEETGHLLERAEAYPMIEGVVGWGDLTSASLADQLAAWREGPGGQRLVGLRHLVTEEADTEWLERPAVRRGLATVTEAGLSFDLLVKLPQLPSAIRTVQALPTTRFVLDHLAKPPFESGTLEEWAGQIRLLAAQPNVSAKVSGLITEAVWTSWTVEEFAPSGRRGARGVRSRPAAVRLGLAGVPARRQPTPAWSRRRRSCSPGCPLTSTARSSGTTPGRPTACPIYPAKSRLRPVRTVII